MAYRIVYDVTAEQVRRKLPMSARVALRLKLSGIIRELEQHNTPPASGSRTAAFGGNSQGLVVYYDTARRVIHVTMIIWAK